MFYREIFWLVISRFLYFLVTEYKAAEVQARRGPDQLNSRCRGRWDGFLTSKYTE